MRSLGIPSRGTLGIGGGRMIRRAMVVAGKEYRHLLHDPLTLVMIFGLPLFQLILYGYALDTRVRHVSAAVVNRDEHVAGRTLAARLSRGALFSTTPAVYRTDAEVQSAMRSGAIRVAIEIPRGYTSDLMYGRKAAIRVWLDGSDPVISNYVLSALDAFGFEEAAAAGPLGASPVQLVPAVDVNTQVLFNPRQRTSAFIIPGLIAILVQTLTMMLLALSFASEREKGTLEQILVTPIGVDSIVLGKSAAIGFIALAECGFLVLAMRYLFGIAIQGSAELLIGMFPVLVLAPVGMGLMIAALVRNFAQALQITSTLSLVSVMLSGLLFSREFLSVPMRWAGQLLPATYLVALSRNIILRGTAFAETAPVMVIALAFGLGLVAAGWWAVRRSMA